jgi:predicted small metal-binding protein
MYEFRCGSPVCKTHFTAATEDELMPEVAAHFADKHRLYAPTKSIVAFVKEFTIHEIPSTTKAGAPS